MRRQILTGRAAAGGDRGEAEALEAVEELAALCTLCGPVAEVVARQGGVEAVLALAGGGGGERLRRAAGLAADRIAAAEPGPFECLLLSAILRS